MSQIIPRAGMDQPLVSIVVTCYNYGRYLRGCLQSILAQTYENLEIVVVNDGSVDETDEVMASFTSDDRFNYIKQENSGQAVAKNVGIDNSHGEYVAFLDADDLWHPDKLAKEVARFQNPAVGVVYCGVSFVDENGSPTGYAHTGQYLQPRRGKVTEYLIFDNFVPFSSAVVRKACLDAVGGFDVTFKMGIDWDLWLRISTRYDFDFVEDKLFYYRMGHGGQMSNNMAERHRCSDRITSKFLDLHPEALSRETVARSRSYSYCNRAYYFRRSDRRKAMGYYLKAIKNAAADLAPYKGIVNLLLGR